MRAAEKRFTLMVRALSADLYRYARMMCRDHNQAEDLVQETFMRAWRSLDQLRDASKAKAYLITTLRREHARNCARFQPHFDDIDIEQLQSELRADADDETVSLVRAAVARLSPKQREVILLDLIWGYTGVEIAQLLGLTHGTVHTRLCRARKALRAHLADNAARPTLTAGPK